MREITQAVFPSDALESRAPETFADIEVGNRCPEPALAMMQLLDILDSSRRARHTRRYVGGGVRP